MRAEEVVSAYGGMVYRLAFARMGKREDAEEVFQEVFLRYFRREREFRDEEHRRAWLLRVTVNRCSSLWSSPWRRRTVPLDPELPAPAREDPALWEALERLSPKYREVIHLFYYEQLSLEEISRVLGRKNATVRSQLTRARAQLRDLLKEE